MLQWDVVDRARMLEVARSRWHQATHDFAQFEAAESRHVVSTMAGREAARRKLKSAGSQRGGVATSVAGPGRGPAQRQAPTSPDGGMLCASLLCLHEESHHFSTSVARTGTESHCVTVVAFLQPAAHGPAPPDV